MIDNCAELKKHKLKKKIQKNLHFLKTIIVLDFIEKKSVNLHLLLIKIILTINFTITLISTD